MSSLAQHGHFGGFFAATNAPVLTCGHAPSIRIVGACAWLLLLPSLGRSADAQPASAPAIKAVFVLSFMRFAEWPGTAFAAPEAPLVLCVSGARSDPGDTLQSLNGRSIQGRPLSIRGDVHPGELQTCNAAYLGDVIAPAPGDTANTAGTALTVGDPLGFVAADAMIGLNSEDGKIHFKFNAGSAQDSALEISSQLMKLARIADRKRSGDSK